MKNLIVAVWLCLLPILASAQTHPCDQPPPTQPPVLSGAPHRVQMCLLQADNVEAIVAYIDGVAFDLLPITAQTGPSAVGKVLYVTGQFLQVSRGTHTLILAGYNRNLAGALQLGQLTPPFPFAAADENPAPGVPAIVGIVR